MDSDGWSGQKRWRYAGVGGILGIGGLMGTIEARHASEMSATSGEFLLACIPLFINVGLIGAGVALWRSSLPGTAVARVGGYVILGAVAVGVLATWTILHQQLMGDGFVHRFFVTVNNMSVGGMFGFVLGWYSVQNRRHRRQMEDERDKLSYLNGILRHNILNGMQTITGHGDALEDHVSDTGASYLETIRGRSEELTRFVRSIRVFTDTTDPETADLRPLDLCLVLDEVVSETEQTFPDADLALDCPEDTRVLGDVFTTELFRNVIHHAVQYGDTPPSVSVTVETGAETVTVAIADTGPGIPDARKETVLQWDADQPGSARTGARLAAAEFAARRYGGSLRVADNEPTGTVVSVELPAAGSDSETADAPLRTERTRVDRTRV